MRHLSVDTHVRLRDDLARVRLSRGSRGTVCSVWQLPEEVYEVEFTCADTGELVRALLAADQIDPDDRHDLSHAVEAEPALAAAW